MRKLPQFNFSEGFYIWFNPEAKEEYYSTPMYLYKIDTYNDMDNHRRKIIQESDFISINLVKRNLHQNTLLQYMFHIMNNLACF